MNIDLHCHTTASDGRLSPADVLERAEQTGIDVLSITDHDTTAAYTDLSEIKSARTTLVPGIEFSTQHRGTEIHVLGLNLDIHHPSLRAGIRVQQERRDQRAERIAKKLEKRRIPNPLPIIRMKARNSSIGRLHFARHLVDTGVVKDVKQAFQRFLGAGKSCYVQSEWAPMPQIIDWIKDAGGTAVLAHPAKYGLTGARLNELLDTFLASGGRAMEVVSGRQQPDLTRRLARLCVGKSLLASCGSDFHQPDLPWSELGAFPEIPAECTPVWEEWNLAPGLTASGD